jgi:small subunit ribosomal protein S3
MGIKVWIMKGEVYGKRDLSPLVGMDKKQAAGGKGDAPRGELKSVKGGKGEARKRK